MRRPLIPFLPALTVLPVLTVVGMLLGAVAAATAFTEPGLTEPAIAGSNDARETAGDPVTSIDEAKSDVSEEQAEHFRTKVLPLLESRCFECHGDAAEVEAELRLTSRKAMLKGGESGAAIVPADPDRSLLIQAIRYETFQMPPRSKMPDEEVAILVKWVKDGAPWPSDMESTTVATAKRGFPLEERIASHWAWKKLTQPAVPEVQHENWSASNVDRFLLARMEAAGLTPAPDADRRAIVRRLYFDLTGLPPTLEQQEKFFLDTADTPAAMEKVVDELLASPQFGERWARHWLDLMRYAETLGHEFDFPLPYAWRYRDYVIRALNADVPYDTFVREHLAGDLMEQPRRNPELGFNESIIATGFWYLCEDKHAPVDVKGEEASRIDNQIDVFGKTFMGLTIACARCHDHKFDAITAEDYYALSGFLQSSRRRIEWLDSLGETEALVSALKQAQAATSAALKSATDTLGGAKLEDWLRQAMEPAGTISSDDSSGVPKDPQVEWIRTQLTAPTSQQLSHPLSLLATMVQASADVPASDQIQQWLDARNAKIRESSQTQESVKSGWVESKVGASNLVAADLRAGIPENWRAFGAAFASLPAGENGVEWAPAGALPQAGQGVSSAILSPKLRGQLHSPEFVLTHPEIHILVAGKGTRVRLMIDGYVMNEFSELLFGGCRQPIDTEGEFRWIRIAGDVGRYLGHRCHLEFLDDGDGWFSVREVRLVSQPDGSSSVEPELARTNSQLTVSRDSSKADVIHQVADILGHDAVWQAMLVSAKMLPPDSSAAYQVASSTWTALTEKSQSGDPVLVMCDGSGEDEYVFIRGNHNNRGPTARRHMLTALDRSEPLKKPDGSGRMELADRVFSDENPFPARVMVNRVWQHLFGRGIVPTSDNFGVLGEAPSHPELLDALALEFRNDGWSVKRLIKRLVLSRAYRLSSQRSELSEQKDPQNKLLHRFSIRRLEGEALRDAILTVSGRLDLTMYGEPVPVYLSSFMQGRGRPGQSGPLDGSGRRSIYQGVNRNFLNPFMLAFDTPQPATAIGRRSMSNVPAQALMLMNNEFVHEQAGVWAARLMREVPSGDQAIIKTAFLQAFARMPAEEELNALTSFCRAVAVEKGQPEEQALQQSPVLEELCHILLNQKEFLFLD